MGDVERKFNFSVQADVWDMQDGEVVRVKIGDRFFKVDGSPDVKTVQIYNIKPKHKRSKRGTKLGIFRRWIIDNNRVDFNIDEFYKDCPQFRETRYQKNLERTIAIMCDGRELYQVGDVFFE